jgi:sugar phosphate isomerase/epimerase
MQFGISTHLYHGARLDRDHLVEIAAHGFEAVEIFATRTHFDYHDDHVVAELEGHLIDTRLRAHSVHAPIAEGYRNGVWGAPYSVANSDRAARQLAVEESVAAIRAASRLGAGLVVVHPGIPTDQHPGSRDNRTDALVDSVEELAAVAAPLGVRLALEVIPNRLAGADTLVDLLEDELDLDGLGICLDTGHAFLLGDVTEAVETAAGYLVTTHLHDNDGRVDDHRVPFDGGIDWPTVMMAFRKIGYEGTWMFELAGPNPPRQILESAERARRRFEGLLSS